MRKCYCDSCLELIVPLDVNVLEVPCHLFSMRNKCGYSDVAGNNVSRKRDQIDLCNKCWNVAHNAALKAIGLVQ